MVTSNKGVYLPANLLISAEGGDLHGPSRLVVVT